MRLNTGHKLIFLLWFILTIININKAYHIDDTFHLKAALHIQENPLRPMSGMINWEDSPTPMYEHNQPPLFFYIISITQALFGSSEIIMHLLVSVFTLISLILFSKISLFLNIKNKNTLLIIFALCPAFVVNQNLMTDIPILAITLGAMYYLLKGLKSGLSKHFFVSALFLSAGLLIKYSLLPLVLVLLISILLSKDYKKAIVVAIPLLTLALWSIWNFIEFQSFHILDRPKSGIHIKRVFSFLGTLGSISFFTPIFIYYLLPKKSTVYLIFSGCALFLISIPLVYFNVIDTDVFNKYLNYTFIGNGMILIISILYLISKELKLKKKEYFSTSYFPIALYILGFSAFIGFLAPFNATRHILLIIPFILFFGHIQFSKSPKAIQNLILTTTILLGILMGVSDWLYADFYRKAAREVNTEGATWSVGHWGWQWYSEQNGMKIYAENNAMNVRIGDLVVFPKDISQQKMSNNIELDTIDYITEEPNLLTFISGKNHASMYNSFRDKPAWTLSNIPIDTVFICRVSKEIEPADIAVLIKSDSLWFDSVKQKAVHSGTPIDSILTTEVTSYIKEQRAE